MPNSNQNRTVQRRQPDQPVAHQDPDPWGTLKGDLGRNRSVYADLLGGKKAASDPEVDRFIMTCYQVVWHKPDLLAASRDSLLLAFAEAAATRLSLTPMAKEGFIEVRSGVARFKTQYQGLIKLMHRGNDIDFMHVAVVRRGDEFVETGGSDPKIVHVAATLGSEPDDYDSDESILAAYAVVKLRGATRAVHEVARRAEILKAQAMSKGKGGKPPSPAWAAWFPRMAMKLPIRRLSNRLPGADEARTVLAVEDAQERGETVTLERVEQFFGDRDRKPLAPRRFDPDSPKDPDELRAMLNATGPAGKPKPPTSDA